MGIYEGYDVEGEEDSAWIHHLVLGMIICCLDGDFRGRESCDIKMTLNL